MIEEFKSFILEQEKKYFSKGIKLSDVFNQIDKYTKQRPEFFDFIISKIEKDFAGEITIITSGEVGDLLKEHIHKNEHIIQIKGSIRKREEKLDLSEFKNKIKGNLVFFDDSFDTGKTYFTIESEIKRLGFDIEKSYFFYFRPNTKETPLPNNYYSIYTSNP